MQGPLEGRDVLGHPLGLHSVGAPCTPISDPALSVGCHPTQLRGVKSRRLLRRTGRKGNGFVLAFTAMLWVLCLCLSRSACFKERAAGVPEEPASQPHAALVSLWPLVPSLHTHAGAFPTPGALPTPSSPANAPPSTGAPQSLLPSHLHQGRHTSHHPAAQRFSSPKPAVRSN